MHLDGFNLNLLIALDALLASPTLTEASQRLALTQPALSSALKRLREHYGDPLILYSPSGASLTPLAERLAPMVRDILILARGTVKLQASFDPREAKTALTIAAADWIELVLLKDLLGIVSRTAPKMRLTISSVRPRAADELFRDGADMVLTMGRFLSSDYSFEKISIDRLACIAWTGNAAIGDRLDRRTFAALPHLGLVDGPDDAPTMAFYEMNADRRIVMRTSIHAALPHIVIGTDMLAVTLRSFAEQAAKTLPIRVFDLPYDLSLIEMFVQWPSWRDRDPALIWLREQLRDCARSIDRADAG